MRCEQQAAGTPAIDWIERAAVGASFLCLVHCLVLPLLLAALPALSRAMAVPQQVHLWLLGFAVPSSALALVTGHRGHGASIVLLLGGAGLALMAAGALIFGGSAAETVATVAGSLGLAGAHIANWRLRHNRHPHG